MLAGLGLLATLDARAQYLRIDADLILKPQPEWSQSQVAMQVQPSTKLPNMHFEQPYKNDWSNVQASLLDGLEVKTTSTGPNEIYVDLTWKRPGVLVYDLVLADGKCFGVNWRLPEGGWKVQGRIVYDPSGNSIGWQEFSFLNEASGSPTVNLGDCTLTPARMEQLTRDLMAQVVNPNWMEPLVRRAVLDWTQVTRTTGYGNLLQAMTLQITDCVTLEWQPKEVRQLPSGMWRVPGQLVLKHNQNEIDFGTLARTETDAAIDAIKVNTMVLPLNAMEQIAAATARNRGFHGFVKADDVPMFRTFLADSKKMFREWPDLLKFPYGKTNMKFHVAVYGPVTLSDRKPAANKKSVNLAHKSAMQVTSMVPVDQKWYPYFDFRSVETGRTDVGVSDSKVTIGMKFDALHLRDYLRDEFAQVRQADPYVSIDQMIPRFSQMFQLHQFSFSIPRWELGNGYQLSIDGVSVEPKSLKLPLKISTPQSPLKNGTVLRVVDAT